jgi:carboxyl-terminal processing protease
MVTDFQRDSGLYPYGVLDFTTQDALMKALDNYQHDDSVDLQLQKALEVLR